MDCSNLSAGVALERRFLLVRICRCGPVLYFEPGRPLALPKVFVSCRWHRNTAHRPRAPMWSLSHRRRHEAHLSAQQPTQSTKAWLSRTYEHPSWPRHLEVASGQGPSSPERLIGRIQSRSAFLRLRQEGIHVRSGPLSCTMFLDSSLSSPQVGYALGRHFGSAVRRNRVRRQLRELVKTREGLLLHGVYVFGASPRAHGIPFADLGNHLDRLLKKVAERVQPWATFMTIAPTTTPNPFRQPHPEFRVGCFLQFIGIKKRGRAARRHVVFGPHVLNMPLRQFRCMAQVVEPGLLSVG